MTMTRSSKPSSQNQDDLLAEFTDRLLEGKADEAASSQDAELRGLEETVLRLNRAFPKGAPDASNASRLQSDFQARVRKENREQPPAWRSRQSRQRLGLLFAAIAIVIVVLVVTPLLPVDKGSILGTAGTQLPGIGLAVVLGALLLLALWLARRK
jgi:hypothetical protein